MYPWMLLYVLRARAYVCMAVYIGTYLSVEMLGKV